MIDRILTAFKTRVKDHNWIDNKTTEGILDKVNMLNFSVILYLQCRSVRNLICCCASL